MFSRIHWNLLSALNSLLNFPWYTKFRFPHCHKVTKESQELTLINCKLNECHFFSTVHLPVCFFAGLFFKNHLPSLHPAISTSTSNWTEIKFFLIWALKFPPPFSQNVHLLFTSPRHRKKWLPCSSILSNVKSSRDALEINSCQFLHHQLSHYFSIFYLSIFIHSTLSVKSFLVLKILLSILLLCDMQSYLFPLFFIISPYNLYLLSSFPLHLLSNDLQLTPTI